MSKALTVVSKELIERVRSTASFSPSKMRRSTSSVFRSIVAKPATAANSSSLERQPDHQIFLDTIGTGPVRNLNMGRPPRGFSFTLQILEVFMSFARQAHAAGTINDRHLLRPNQVEDRVAHLCCHWTEVLVSRPEGFGDVQFLEMAAAFRLKAFKGQGKRCFELIQSVLGKTRRRRTIASSRCGSRFRI